MFDWFFALEQSNKVVIALFSLGAAWGAIKLYANSVKPKHSSPSEPTQIVRFTIDEYEARIKSKIENALEERGHATGKDLDIKNAQIATLRNDLANINEAFEKQKKFITGLEIQLIRVGNTIGVDALEKATQAIESGDTSLAQSLFEDIKSRAAPDVQASARASFALGEIAEEEIRWADAFAHYNDAAQLDPIFAHIIRAQNMAIYLAEYEDAILLGREAEIAAKTEFGENSQEYSLALNDLAVGLKYFGQTEEAESLYMKALEIAKVVLGQDHHDYGERLNNIGALYRATNRKSEAEPMFLKALEIARNTVGEDHPDFGVRLNNLGLLLKATGRNEKAEPLLREAVRNARVALGECHPDVGKRLNNLGSLMENAGRYQEAEVLYKSALEITRAALGEDHSSFGIRLNNLAKLFESTDRYEEAEPLYLQAVEVSEKALGSNHPRTQKVRANYERILANRPPAD